MLDSEKKLLEYLNKICYFFSLDIRFHKLLLTENVMSKNATLQLPDEPVVHTTSRGGRYVKPYDILRSKVGRMVIHNYTRKSHRPSSERPDLPVAPETDKK